MLTIGSTYYKNPQYLLRFVNRNLPFVDEMIIIDDGSPDPILNYLTPTKKIKIYRVKQDYGFNSHGCRNLIMKVTNNPWVILMDLDREFIWPEEAYDAISNTKLQKDIRYRFVAHAGEIGQNIHPSVNDYLINKNHFFKPGGYDEEIIGQRWGDREFFLQLLHYGSEKVLHGVDMLLTRKPSSMLLNAKSKNDKPIDNESKLLIQQRIITPEPNKPILTFEWEQVL